MTIHHYDPVEVIDGAAPFRLPAVSLALFAAALVMVLLGAKPLLDWVNALPIGGFSDALLSVAVLWSELCNRLGLNAAFTETQNWFRQFQALRF
jgi:hypothetical protein